MPSRDASGAGHFQAAPGADKFWRTSPEPLVCACENGESRSNRRYGEKAQSVAQVSDLHLRISMRSSNCRVA